MTVYISGGITGVDNYKDRFEAAERKLRENGYADVINPAAISELLPKTMPWCGYMDIMLPLLKYCDAIYLLRDWENSEGARIENLYAMRLGLRIMEER